MASKTKKYFTVWLDKDTISAVRKVAKLFRVTQAHIVECALRRELPLREQYPAEARELDRKIVHDRYAAINAVELTAQAAVLGV